MSENETEIRNQSVMQSAKPEKGWDWSILTDNPIIIKQSRVRLKRSSMISWFMTIGVLASAVIWMEFQFGTKRYDRSAGYILGGMIFMMLLAGTQQLALMITATRATGMIDFHRLSPQSPLSLMVGFLVGGPIREYAIVAFGMPFLILACVLYGTPLLGLFVILLAAFSLALLLYGLTLVSAMLSKNPNPNAAKGASWGVFAAVGMLAPLLSGTMAVDRLAGDPPKAQFYGIATNVPIVFTGIASVASAFFLVAGVRRFKDDIRPSLTKRQTILALSMAVLIGWGLMFQATLPYERFVGALELSVIGFWVATSFILCGTAAPDRVTYIGGLRRSLRLGLRRPGPFEDRALNRSVIVVFAVILAIGILGLYTIRNPIQNNAVALPGASTATAILVALEFGLALQYYRLRLGKQAGGAFALFLFVAWFVPFILGMALTLASGISEVNEANGYILMSISPLFGVPLGADTINISDIPIKECQLAALIPTLFAVFIFNQMITNLQRRIDRRILPEHQSPNADPFAWLDNATPQELVARKMKS
jgi:hypothetical protein